MTMSQNPNVYKLDVFWTAWSQQVVTRIIRDVLALQRLTKVNRVTLVVAADEQLHSKLVAIGVQPVTNFLEPDMVRVYLADGDTITDEIADRIPEDVQYEVVTLHGTEKMPQLEVDPDPYAGIEFYKDWRPITETMPLDSPAPPPHNPEPIPSPLL